MQSDLTKTEARAGDRNKVNVRVLVISAALAAVVAIVALSYAVAV